MQFTTSLPLDQLDQLDPVDQLACAKVVFRVHETLVWNTPADPPDPPDPAEVVSSIAAQALPSHAPGARMTVVN